MYLGTRANRDREPWVARARGIPGKCVPMESDFVWWALPTLAATQRPALMRLRDAGERERAARFAFDPDRDAYIVAHALLRLALARATGRAAATWRFVHTPEGKPRAAGADGPAFSLSHARGIVACCIAGDGPVGLDVEDLPAVAPDPNVLERACSPAERAMLRGTLPEQMALAFTQMWTIKEAVAKAVGAGPHLPFDQISCALDPPRVIDLPAGSWAAPAWQIDLIQPTETTVLTRACAHHAVRRKPFSLRRITDDVCISSLAESP